MLSTGKTRLLCVVIFLEVFTLQSARADVITDWNATAITVSTQTNSLVQSRALAIAHAAVFDAVNAIGGKYRAYRAQVKAPADASQEAAAATAAHAVLTWLFPAQRSILDRTLAGSLAKVAEGAGKDAGIAVGRQVAEQYIAARGEDGAEGIMDYTPGNGAGQWQPTPPANAGMALPHWAAVKPFVLASAAELAVKGPPPLDSAQFAKDLDEVRRLGARDSSDRTADQTAAAIFWVINTPEPWNAAARAAATARGTSVLENARIFALMNMAGADGYIASWVIKKQHNFWRPVTAIRTGAHNADPAWEPLLITPAHPDYISGHCIYSGAAARALQQLFGDNGVAFTATFGGPNGVMRTFRGLAEAEKEVEGARVWGGIHFRTADEHGTDLGRRIADLALRRHMQPVSK